METQNGNLSQKVVDLLRAQGITVDIRDAEAFLANRDLDTHPKTESEKAKRNTPIVREAHGYRVFVYYTKLSPEAMQKLKETIASIIISGWKKSTKNES